MSQDLITNQSLSPSPSSPEDSLRLKPTFRYFRRTFHLNTGDSINALKLNLKRIHIKKLVEVDNYCVEGSDAEKKRLEANKRCLKKKLFKYFTDLHLLYLNTSDWLEEFKHARSLIKLSFRPGEDYPASIIAPYFKRMNKHVENIEFFIEDSSEMEPCDILRVSKVIRGFPKLKVYKGQTELSEWKHEFQYLYRHLPKISKLQDFEYFFPKKSQNPFQELMKEGKIYPKVTKLSVTLGRIPDEEGEENKDSEVYKKAQVNLLFPNLKALQIKARELDESLYPNFCSSLAQAFEHLPRLEKLSLKFASYPLSTDFILQGLLKLPLLSSFSFRIESMSSSQGSLLNTFMKAQTNLVSIHLEIRNSDTEELQENQFLENFIESLSNRPLLQYLTLNLNSWGVQSISEGFKNFQGSDQIKAFHFKIRKFVEFRPMENPLNTLCEFLLRNKNTLDDLTLDLAVGPIFEAEIYDSLSMTIAQLTQLQNFMLAFSLDENKMANYKFNFDLKSILFKLGRLQSLVLKLDYLLEFPPESRKWIVECFEVVPLLKNLRRFKFSVPTESLDQTERSVIEKGLKGLDHSVNVCIIEPVLYLEILFGVSELW